MTLAVREARLRRLTRRYDLMLMKNRSRTPQHPTYGGFMLVGLYRNVIVFGAYPNPFTLDLDDVEHWLTAP